MPMDPRNISIQDFNYHLPDDRIARYPLAERDASKLLIYKNNVIEQDVYAHLADYIPENTLLFFNNTKVVEARLLFTKSTGGAIELFCLEPDKQYSDITSAMLQKSKVQWNCLVGGAKKWKAGELLQKEINSQGLQFILSASMIQKNADSFLIELSWDKNDLSFAEVLHLAGVIPLPPYLNRAAEDSDQERYQTVYAKYDGSVAAPTAGLHFTDALIQKLAAKNIQHTFVTLHVGAGTFKPVKSETLEGHEMHAEFIDVNLDTLERILVQQSNPIIPVGTTSFRTIETLYWMGVKAFIQPNASLEELEIKQWDVYELPQDISRGQSLTALLDWMKLRSMHRIICKTQLLVTPGYTIRIADAIITNFHQPNSTLLLLIAAFVGEQWKTIYDYALANDFRFLSYGDGSLLWKQK
jgi:S-adenosylmethionine:tRNA ribosyltransferase-isomerase